MKGSAHGKIWTRIRPLQAHHEDGTSTYILEFTKRSSSWRKEMFRWSFRTRNPWWFDMTSSTSENLTAVHSTGKSLTSNDDGKTDRERGKEGGTQGSPLLWWHFWVILTPFLWIKLHTSFLHKPFRRSWTSDEGTRAAFYSVPHWAHDWQETKFKETGVNLYNEFLS